jgi:hypothetical protein
LKYGRDKLTIVWIQVEKGVEKGGQQIEKAGKKIQEDAKGK